jgi:large subunit ribosomal protein L22
MANGHRSQIKRERNAVKDTRPSAKLSYARVSVQKACFVLDAIRGKDVQTALGILEYNPRYASSLIKKLLESRALMKHLQLLCTIQDMHHLL